MELAAMDGDLFGDVRRADGARRGRASPSRLCEPLYPPSRTRRSIQSQGSSRRRPHLVTVAIRHIKYCYHSLRLVLTALLLAAATRGRRETLAERHGRMGVAMGK